MIVQHAVKNAMIPVLTVLGPIFAGLITGSFIVENAFATPGLGNTFVSSVLIRDYGVNHFKFDGIAAGMYASGGSDYVRDTEAMRRLMLELRAEDPRLYINLTTGSWPSPFWLRFADSV